MRNQGCILSQGLQANNRILKVKRNSLSYAIKQYKIQHSTSGTTGKNTHLMAPNHALIQLGYIYHWVHGLLYDFCMWWAWLLSPGTSSSSPGWSRKQTNNFPTAYPFASRAHVCLSAKDGSGEVRTHTTYTYCSMYSISPYNFPQIVTCVEANPPRAFLCLLSQCTSLLTALSLMAKSGLETWARRT